MAARLILNADDFGLTPGINRAIIELHRAGVLTSATLMATGPAFADAVALALSQPTLGVGCHIVLTDGIPVSHPQSIPSLLGSDGKHFRPSLADFLQALVRGRIDERHIEREALAQVQALQRAGIDVTHLDTHKHTHIFPQVARPLLRIAESTSIGAIRNPFEPAWARRLHHASPARRLQLALLNRLEPRFTAQRTLLHRSVETTLGSLGIAATGTLDIPTLTQLLTALSSATAASTDPVYELLCHPGYSDPDLDRIPTRLRAHRDRERSALLTVIPSLLSQPDPPQLIHYGHLGSYGLQRLQGTHIPDTGY